jgi:hypothetical protein
MWLYVLGLSPVVALSVGLLIRLLRYMAEQGPIIGSRWIDFLDKLDDFRTRRRQRRKRR